MHFISSKITNALDPVFKLLSLKARVKIYLVIFYTPIVKKQTT
ncbi:hypothetical protein FLB_11270 [Flavobacterium succinicans]|uniref:Uncharacterized protein n=1 Tax=Flavobacterium succinicans TaxID=29536 RepID=A0A199XS29_9FLAO|nr:hypothetical protein FLB_11270 [Flavobacterium succinicans]